jgi:dihydroorotate dehydrogenase (fumarate)
MDLTTEYLGHSLGNPFMPGSSPLPDELDVAKRLEDAGAGAIVLRSLFEEQVMAEELATHEAVTASMYTSAEAASYFPEVEDYRFGPDAYLEHLRRVKEAVAVPVFASLNGRDPEGFLRYGRLIQEAGADGLELNVYAPIISPERSGSSVEEEVVQLVGVVKQGLDLPVAVKLSPFYSSPANLAQRLEGVGADALVIFNRFYQPDIDIERLEVARTLALSSSSELLLRLRWLAILRGRVGLGLAVTGGVHSPDDAIKSIMAGADVVQVVSALLERGPGYLGQLRRAVELWLEDHEYESLAQARGSMSLGRVAEPEAYERANYLKILQGYGGRSGR